VMSDIETVAASRALNARNIWFSPFEYFGEKIS
jgi:hypothetical protein